MYFVWQRVIWLRYSQECSILTHYTCYLLPWSGDPAISLTHASSPPSSSSGPRSLQPFSQKSRTPTVAKEFQIGLYDPAETDLEHFWNCCSAGFSGERLYFSMLSTHFQGFS